MTTSVNGSTNGAAASADGRTISEPGLRSGNGSAALGARLNGRLKVWIDQDLCTGDGICTDHAPEVFTILEDGIAYCREGERTLNDPGGSAELAVVPPSREVDVIDAAADCPGECIFIEFEEFAELEE